MASACGPMARNVSVDIWDGGAAFGIVVQSKQREYSVKILRNTLLNGGSQRRGLSWYHVRK